MDNMLITILGTTGFFIFILAYWLLKTAMSWQKFLHTICYPCLDYITSRKIWTHHIEERHVKSLETNTNVSTIIVIVNHLQYELAKEYGYDLVMVKNLNRDVRYYYSLPDTPDMRKDWETVVDRLKHNGVTEANIKNGMNVRFIDSAETAYAVYGIAIYKGDVIFKFKHKEAKFFAVHYSISHRHSFLIDTSPSAQVGAKTVQIIIDEWQKNLASYI